MMRWNARALWSAAMVLGALSCGCAGTDYASSGPRMLPGTDVSARAAAYPGTPVADRLPASYGGDEKLSVTARVGGMIPLASDLEAGLSANFDFGLKLGGPVGRTALLFGVGTYSTSKSGPAEDPYIGTYDFDLQVDVIPITFGAAFSLVSTDKMNLYITGGLGYYMADSTVEAFGAEDSASADSLGGQVGGGVSWSAGRTRLGVDAEYRIVDADFGRVGEDSIGGLVLAGSISFAF